MYREILPSHALGSQDTRRPLLRASSEWTPCLRMGQASEALAAPSILRTHQPESGPT